MAVCYRHPNVETRVSCSNCGNPICTDCMTSTSVGMRCPDCAQQTTKVRTAVNLSGTDEPRVVYAIIAACVIAFLAFGTGTQITAAKAHWVLFGPLVDQGEYYRLVTSAFLHSGFLHLGFNMYILYIIGRELELAIGSSQFATVYGTALLWGSMGALLVTPNTPILGASGAVFGVLGAMMVELHRRGMDPFGGGLGALLLLNIVLGFILPNVAWGGHIGGLIGGALASLAFGEAIRRRQPALGFVLCGVLSAVAVAGSIAIAATSA